METTILNPESNPRRRRRKAKRRYVRRRNAEANPRRRRRRATRRYYRNENPRRRRRRAIASRSRRRNPENPEINFGRILYANGGGILARLAMRKAVGKRVMEGAVRKLDTMHYVAMLGAVYFGPDIADAIGATPDEARAFADGAAAVGGQYLIDQHLKDFSAANLMPFDSPTPTGTDMAGMGSAGGAVGLGASRSNPMPYDSYMRLSGLGQLPPGGVYVRGADGSVWWFPSGQRRALAGGGMSGCASCHLGAGNGRARDLPEHIPVGAVVRDTDSGERFVVGREGAAKVLIPYNAKAAGMGAGYGDYLSLVARR